MKVRRHPRVGDHVKAPGEDPKNNSTVGTNSTSGIETVNATIFEDPKQNASLPPIKQGGSDRP
jgi:hypothetical protein